MIYELLIAIFPWLIFLCLVWVGITYLFQRQNFFSHVASHWHQPFHNQHFSSKEIYAAITEAIKERQIPNLSFSTAEHYQGGYFSEKREYLKISRGHTMFLVCAAPFGSDYFISYWLGEPMSVINDLLIRLPFIGRVIAKQMQERTFFQVDTDTMFLGSVKYAVADVVEQLNESKGIRPPAALEQKGNNTPKKTDDVVEYI